MKRKLTMFFALTLVLAAMAAAQAAGGPGTTALKVLGSVGDVTAAVRTTYTAGGKTRELVYTTDGRTWHSAEVEGSTANVADIAYGRAWDGVLLAVRLDTVPQNWILYLSEDGIHWRERVEESWFGSDDYRDTCSCGPYTFQLHQGRLYYTRGGVGSAELPAVANDTWRRGLDYAEVRAYPVGEELVNVEVYDRWDLDGSSKLTLTYTRDSLDWVQGAAWDAGAGAGAIQQLVSNGTGILCTYNSTPPFNEAGSAWSYDGRLWEPVPKPCTGAFWAGDIADYNGRTFTIVDGATGEIFYTEDPSAWKQVPISERFPREEFYADYIFLWTGGEYISFQKVSGYTWMFGYAGNPNFVDPYANCVSFFDADFQELSHHDLGQPVWDVGYAGGTWYAVTRAERDGPMTVWASTDQTTWTKTALEQVPQDLPQGVAALSENDVWAAPYVFRLSGDDLLVSRDGTAFARLGPAPQPSGDPGSRPTQRIRAAVGRDGAIVLGQGWKPDAGWANNGGVASFTRQEIEAALLGAMPG